MKNNKNIIITIESIAILALAITLIVIPKQLNFKTKDKVEPLTLKETAKDIPNFSLTVSGAYKGKIDKDLIAKKNIKLYEFDASINSGWSTETDTYIGYKLVDILNAFDITDFVTIEFCSSDGIKVSHEKYLLNDNYFIVFYVNDKQINEDYPAMFLTPEFNFNYSVPKLQAMDFSFVTRFDESSDQDNSNNEQTQDTNPDKKDE